MSFAAYTILLLSLAAASPAAVADDSLTAYEALARYNFPVGILPKGVTGYELDKSTGNFRAYLNGSCSFSLEGSYQLKYASTVSGIISENKLTELRGVSVKILFFWLNIVQVVRYENELGFSVGIASASFPIDNFYVCPQCGCGLDCNTVKLAVMQGNPNRSRVILRNGNYRNRTANSCEEIGRQKTGEVDSRCCSDIFPATCAKFGIQKSRELCCLY